MLSADEKKFISYWEDNRLRKKKFMRQFSIGLPLGVLLVLLLLVNVLSGWYERADMVFRSNSSLIIVLLVATTGIVVFITIFSAKHQWDQNEQRYLYLKAKEQKLSSSDATHGG
jgi:membrane protein YdbS with pleckstrin-like domain